MTKEQFEAFQSRWVDLSTRWEQGAEGPAATDRGSFKCGFFEGIDWAESQQLQKMQELEQKLAVAMEALEEFQLNHTHEKGDKHFRLLGDTYGWCDYCLTKVCIGEDYAREALAKIRGVE